MGARKQKTLKLYEQTKALVESGLSAKEAFKQTGMNHSTYYAYKKREGLTGNEVAPVTFTELAETKRPYKKPKATGKIAVLIGSPTEVRSFLNEYL